MWLDQGVSPSIIAVNISANQLQQDDFVEMVKNVLSETELPPQLLCLEVTESTAIMNANRHIDKLRELSHLGVHIAIDDFGTGYSSLSLLKLLPISNIKIDRSFVHDMVENPDDAAIDAAGGMPRFYKKLRIRCISE